MCLEFSTVLFKRSVNHSGCKSCLAFPSSDQSSMGFGVTDN
jgi:hypothetical protein